MKHHFFRVLLAVLAFIALAGLSIPVALAGAAVCLTVTPFNLRCVGSAPSAYPGINAETLAELVSVAGTDVEQVIWELELILSAAQQSPFADNMTGPEGSGKPIISNTNTSRVAGNQIVFGTIDSLGGPGVQGEAERVGNEEFLKPGNFRLTVDLQWYGTGMTNKARAQSIPGATYPEKSKFLLARRLAKKQSDDVMQTLKCSANYFNTLIVNRKTIDTISTADTYQTSLVVASGGLLRDIGCMPMNAAPNPDKPQEKPPHIPKFLSFLTDLGARPIKTEPNYVQAAQLARDRGRDNPLFTGEYLDYDNQVIYAWQNIRHGGWGSIGSALQPEALLGTAILGYASSNTLPAGSGILDGGGSAANAALFPLPLWFEFWSLYSYVGSNGTTQLFNARSTSIAYGAIINSTTGAIMFFSYTGNTGSTLTGVVVAGAATAGNYSAAAIGSVTYGTAPWTTTADGQGFQGISNGAFPSGSLMIECNAKGVPLCFGLPMGEMAAVCGYGNVPVDETLKAMANRTKYTAPHGAAYAYGIEYSWGVAAFKRPDGETPNYLLNIFARSQPGFPQIP